MGGKGDEGPTSSLWPILVSYIVYEKQPGSDTKYRIQKKDAIFFRKSVVYPCAQLEHRKQDCMLTPEEFIQKDSFIENSGLSPI